ncbi:hypothetical protein BGZ60DRAFT_490463 [Tricladium varicosporioides]|nr:hypothetical protein BGZ60DRAFT_490463 [Hymenoscyphus varicosporioides]
MQPESAEAPLKELQRTPTLETGPYVLRGLLEDVPLSADGDRDDIGITCVEFLDQNLYVGTSASELLHFVQIPPDPQDAAGQPSYILASRLLPAYHEPATASRPGVQQILLLARVNKACILCNWTVTFYSLPELSPVFGTTQIRPCNWIGGLDLNMDLASRERNENNTPMTVLVSLNKKMRVIRIGEDARPVRVIDFAGSTISTRRESFACVANTRSYALLDIDRLLKIPLFPISSLDDSQSGSIGGRVEDISGSSAGSISRSSSSAQAKHSGGLADDRSHARSTSLGTFMSSTRRNSQQRPDQSGRETPEGLFREASPAPTVSSLRQPSRDPSPNSNKALPPPPSDSQPIAPTPSLSTPAPVYLKPHIASPTPQEFLLVTGTGLRDPGVGMFVNLEGDVTRPTVEFDVYPEELVVDGRGVGVDPIPTTIDDDEEGFVIASMARDFNGLLQQGLEIQRWDLNPGEGEIEKHWLNPPHLNGNITKAESSRIGLRSIIEKGEISFPEIVKKLCLRRFQPFKAQSLETSTLSLHSIDSRTASSLERVSGERELFESGESLPKGWEDQRNHEELQFAQRFSRTRTRIVAWSGTNIWWVARNPLALRLDATLDEMIGDQTLSISKLQILEKKRIVELINSLRGREARTETEFLSLGYIRQRAGLIFFLSLLVSPAEQTLESDYRTFEEALLEGGLDPRVVLSVVPGLRNEIVEGQSGIWIYGGVKDIADTFITNFITEGSKSETQTQGVLHFLRRLLSAWRKRKGFGSIANEKEVFRSVDAALLLVLILLDSSSQPGPAKGNSIRAELYDLVDHGVDCFERAISILESYNRLYVLSRLYQSRKLAREVLATWRRIVESDEDQKGEFRDGEQKVRDYLTKIRNQGVVQEYGVWLAARNSKLGVQVFADNKGQVTFEPSQVVQILREGAPGAVKDYLEYLVFSKNHSEYINELIAYYLDIVITELERSDASRQTLAQTYESYRALRSPKPTYRQFITDNGISAEWWHSRLRLLQLLGGSQGTGSEYDVAAILRRIAPYTQELVPEVIILDGRQSHHDEALKLLTHGLGDYDTAINYCLLGGSSIYHSVSGTLARGSLPTKEEQAILFSSLLSEFLRIEDISNRVEQTSNLLERFGGWFEIGYVLSIIPDTWSIELVSGFLASALRRIIRERHETTVAKALSSAENLKVTAGLIGTVENAGPSIEN